MWILSGWRLVSAAYGSPLIRSYLTGTGVFDERKCEGSVIWVDVLCVCPVLLYDTKMILICIVAKVRYLSYLDLDVILRGTRLISIYVIAAGSAIVGFCLMWLAVSVSQWYDHLNLSLSVLGNVQINIDGQKCAVIIKNILCILVTLFHFEYLYGPHIKRRTISQFTSDRK